MQVGMALTPQLARTEEAREVKAPHLHPLSLAGQSVASVELAALIPLRGRAGAASGRGAARSRGPARPGRRPHVEQVQPVAQRRVGLGVQVAVAVQG